MGIVLHVSGAQFEIDMGPREFFNGIEGKTLIYLPEHGIAFPVRDFIAIGETEEHLRALTRRIH